MGKPTSSCLKIITCAGGDSTDGEDLTPAVSKASSEKPRWSFRKRSARHRVLSNNLISEPVPVGDNNENPEATNNEFHSPKKFSVPEKASIEDPPLSSDIVNSVVDPLVIGRNSTITDHNLDDSFAVVIQAAIRGYLAQTELLKLKNVIKLQAAVRGHLVRRQAVGTLRCIQSVVKMQRLVRARHGHQYVKQLVAEEDEKLPLQTERSILMGNATSCIEPDKTYSSTEKLLSNRFVCQLLESTPKTKRLHIKCDPSRSNSSWKWLERWMTIMSSDTEEEPEQNMFQDYQVQEKNAKLFACEATNDIPVAVASVSSDSKSGPNEPTVPAEGEGISVIKKSAASEFQDPASVPDDCFSFPPKSDHDQPLIENKVLGMATESDENKVLGMATESDQNTDRVTEKIYYSHSSQIPLLSDATTEPILNSISDSTKRASVDSVENEGKKFALGSRKPCNPAFAAAQSKFEVLSSSTIVNRCINASYQDPLVESEFSSSNSQIDSSAKTGDLSLMENSIPHDPRVQIAASECGTEISISSTLDSPDRSEAEGGEIVLEIGDMGQGNYVVDSGADNGFSLVSENAATKSASLDSEVLEPPRQEESYGNLADSIAAEDTQQVEQQPEGTTTSDMKNQIDNLIDPQVYRSSPEGTPRSHTAVAESHGTPSSQVPVNAKKSKKDNNMPTRKQTTQLMGKKSPSDPNNGSGGRRSTEHLPNDSKNAKRRNSFGTAKPDLADHEPRVSNSNSLPSYMQATESAKAKVHASVSPKSSPDVQDKDNYTKKRRSLPIGNEKQCSSPRMQRSPSQAQQNLKGNGTQSPHNSAERRWQR